MKKQRNWKDGTAMINISGPMNPTVFRSSVSDQWYACAGGEWLEVPEGTKLDDLNWVDDWHKAPPSVNDVHEETVKGSSGDLYSVEVWTDGQTSCNCMGFLYRRRCKHVEALKAKVL
jgi:hypothetical protein